MGFSETNLTGNRSLSKWKAWLANHCQPNFRQVRALYLYIHCNIKFNVPGTYCMGVELFVKMIQNLVVNVTLYSALIFGDFVFLIEKS